MQINKRLGKVRINYKYVYNKPDVITEVLYRLRAVPVEIDQVYNENVLIYTMISDRFDKVSPGEVVPYYNLFITHSDDGMVNKFSIRKCD